MKKLNRLNPIIAGAMLICAAILSACGQGAAPAANANPSAPTENAPVAAAPTVAPTQAPAPTQPPVPTAAPTSANPLEVLSKALTALSSAKTVRLTVNSTTAGKITTIVFEYVNPDAYHMTQANGDEMIAIKDKGAYEKKGGKWSKSPIAANLIDKIIVTVNPIAIIDKERQKLDQKTTPQVGADILGGKPMVTYQYANPQGHLGYVKFWYGVTDGWMYKFEGSDQTSKGDGTIEYNIPISIAPPI
jgi:hypothetical protein